MKKNSKKKKGYIQLTEYIVDDDVFWAAVHQGYRAGEEGRSLYTVRGPNGPEVIRCKDCFYWDGPSNYTKSMCHILSDDDGWDKVYMGADDYCSLAIKDEEE